MRPAAVPNLLRFVSCAAAAMGNRQLYLSLTGQVDLSGSKSAKMALSRWVGSGGSALFPLSRDGHPGSKGVPNNHCSDFWGGIGIVAHGWAVHLQG